MEIVQILNALFAVIDWHQWLAHHWRTLAPFQENWSKTLTARIRFSTYCSCNLANFLHMTYLYLHRLKPVRFFFVDREINLNQFTVQNHVYYYRLSKFDRWWCVNSMLYKRRSTYFATWILAFCLLTHFHWAGRWILQSIWSGMHEFRAISTRARWITMHIGLWQTGTIAYRERVKRRKKEWEKSHIFYLFQSQHRQIFNTFIRWAK